MVPSVSCSYRPGLAPLTLSCSRAQARLATDLAAWRSSLALSRAAGAP